MKILTHEKALRLAAEFMKNKLHFKTKKLREYYKEHGYDSYKPLIYRKGNPARTITPIDKTQLSGLMQNLQEMGHITKRSPGLWAVVKKKRGGLR